MWSPICMGADYSFTKQNARHMFDCGVRGVGLYFGPADSGKITSAAECEALTEAGIFYWGQYEISASSWRGGQSFGQKHGREARGWARSTLGSLWSDEATIYGTYDQNVGAGDHATVQGYQAGFNQGQDVPATPGAYGDGDLLWFLRDQVKLIGHTWLSDSTAFTLSRLFAAQGNPSIVQYFGNLIPGLGGVDKNEIFEHDVGQMPRPTAPPPKRRTVFMDHYFFTIPDAPVSEKISPQTVFESDGVFRRSLDSVDDLHARQFVLLVGGYTQEQVKVNPLLWKFAKSLPVAA